MVSWVNLPGNYQHLRFGIKPLFSPVVQNLDGIRITFLISFWNIWRPNLSPVQVKSEIWGMAPRHMKFLTFSTLQPYLRTTDRRWKSPISCWIVTIWQGAGGGGLFPLLDCELLEDSIWKTRFSIISFKIKIQTPNHGFNGLVWSFPCHSHLLLLLSFLQTCQIYYYL